jgi:type II secretory pathway pseudopilin PulG
MVMKFAVQIRKSKARLNVAACARRGEDGYVLLTLLLVIALMAIFAIAVITPIKFEIQRDQEQEMIHRGVQYSRAIRGYYKKFGRYPVRLEDLDNTNNLRYLRKHYKDPLNKNQDFKLLHFGEPGVTLGGGLSLGGGTIPGANPIGGSGMNSSSPSGSAFGGSGFGNPGVNSSGVFSQSSGIGNANSGLGANSNSQNGSGQPGTTSASGTDPSQTSSQNSPQSGSTDSSSSGQQLVIGGPIVGVASVSKKTTIREFNHKKKYNEWQFIYDPANDRGALITTPNQPALQGFGAQPNLNGQSGSSSSSTPFSSGSGTGSSFNNNSSFGSSSGFGNSSPGAAVPQPPANPPQQQ